MKTEEHPNYWTLGKDSLHPDTCPECRVCPECFRPRRPEQWDGDCDICDVCMERMGHK